MHFEQVLHYETQTINHGHEPRCALTAPLCPNTPLYEQNISTDCILPFSTIHQRHRSSFLRSTLKGAHRILVVCVCDALCRSGAAPLYWALHKSHSEFGRNCVNRSTCVVHPFIISAAEVYALHAALFASPRSPILLNDWATGGLDLSVDDTSGGSAVGSFSVDRRKSFVQRLRAQLCVCARKALSSNVIAWFTLICLSSDYQMRLR